jgi:uncharacterized iron-regulated membrane protein
MSSKLKRAIFKVHSYTGLITGIALLLIGLSGSVLVFNNEIDDLIYSDLQTVKPLGNKISFDSAYHIVQSKFYDMDYIGYDNLPQKESSSYQFFMMKENIQYKAFLNPYTGEILHSGERYNQLMDWLLLFHYTFTIPIWGDLAVAILSVLLFISCITGIIVYRKHLIKVLLFKIRLNFKNWRTISSGLHRVIGVWSLIFNIIIAITAFWMMRYAFTKSNFIAEENTFKSIPIDFSIDAVLNEISVKYPSFKATNINLPTISDKSTYVFGYSGELSFFFGDYIDEIIIKSNTFETKFLSQKTFREKLEGMVFPIHSGVYGTIWIKILYSIFGLTPGLLSITGFLLWWRKKT